MPFLIQNTAGFSLFREGRRLRTFALREIQTGECDYIARQRPPTLSVPESQLRANKAAQKFRVEVAGMAKAGADHDSREHRHSAEQMAGAGHFSLRLRSRAAKVRRRANDRSHKTRIACRVIHTLHPR